MLEAGREPDDVLRAAVSELVREPVVWVEIAFVRPSTYQGDLEA